MAAQSSGQAHQPSGGRSSAARGWHQPAAVAWRGWQKAGLVTLRGDVFTVADGATECRPSTRGRTMTPTRGEGHGLAENRHGLWDSASAAFRAN